MKLTAGVFPVMDNQKLKHNSRGSSSSGEESGIDYDEAWKGVVDPEDWVITEEDRKKIRLLNQKINENKKKRSGTGSFSTPQSKRQKRGRYINPSQEGEEIQFSPNEDTTSSNNHSRTAGGSSSKSDKEVPPKNLAIARISTPTSERGIRKRMRWTKEETDILKAGVQRHGRGSWAAILRDPESAFLRERGRTQVNLKDRWRNLQLGRSRLISILVVLQQQQKTNNEVVFFSVYLNPVKIFYYIIIF